MSGGAASTRSKALSVTPQLPYLVGSLAMLVLCLAAMLARPAHALAATLGGLLSTPYALASVLFVPEYWQPQRVAGSAVGIEDFIFSFAAGGLAWLAAVSLSDQRVNLRINVLTVMARYLTVSGILFSSASFLRFVVGWKTAPSFLITVCLVCGGLVLIRPRLWRLCWTGMIGYGVLYTVFVSVLFLIFPAFREQWTWSELLGWSVLGVPAEEIGYALCFGALWPLTVGFSCSARVFGNDESTTA